MAIVSLWELSKLGQYQMLLAKATPNLFNQELKLKKVQQASLVTSSRQADNLGFESRKIKISVKLGAAKHHGWHSCLQTQQPQDRFPAFLQKFQRNKLSILLRLINCAAKRKVINGLKI